MIAITGYVEQSGLTQAQAAKNHFSGLVKAAEKERPQLITVHGKERAVLLSAEAGQRLLHRGQSAGFHSALSPG